MQQQINPFLDPRVKVPKGELSVVGRPLTTLRLPNIVTLISKTENTLEELSTVNLVTNVTEQVVETTKEEPVSDDLIGFELDLNLFDSMDPTPEAGMSQLNAASLGKTIGRILPTNMREARDMLHLINRQRKGATNETFSIHELRTIAKSLNIPSNGNKDVLVLRLRKEIMDYFNVSE